MHEHMARTPSWKVRTWAVAVLLAATAAGCGGDDDNGNGGNAAITNCGDLIGLAVPASAVASARRRHRTEDVRRILQDLGRN